jgi:hypothetical protein
MKRRSVLVSDHAVLRYLERVGGFNIDGLRTQIAKRIEASCPDGAASITIDGYRFVIREDEKGRVVTTVMFNDWTGRSRPGNGH